MELLCLGADDLARALPMPAAIETARRAYVALASGRACVPDRCVMSAPEPRGSTLVMGGSVPEVGLAAKVVSVNPDNPSRGLPGTAGMVTVLDVETGVPTAICDGTFLTAWRTGAATGAATDALARADARRALVIGTGTQSRTQVLGLDAARSFESISVWGRRADAAETLVASLADVTRAPVRTASDLEAEVAASDVVATATTASAPVVLGSWLRAGTHVNGVGSFRPDMRELDDDAIARSLVFVDTVAGALHEAGELIAAERAGLTDRQSWTEIGQVLAGDVAGRTSADDITFFKSVGNAAQDVTAAAAAVIEARASGLGTMIEL